MTLPTVISPGDVGHIGDHEEIDELLSLIEGQAVALAAGVAQDVLGNRPAAAAGNERWFYFAEDVPGLAYSDGTTWRDFILASTANAFTAVNQFEDDVFFGSGKPWVDPLHSLYGGTGDGVANDTTPLTNAAAAAADGILFLAPNTHWNVHAQVPIPANCDVIGRRASVFNSTAAATVLSLNHDVRIAGLEVYNTGSASTYNDLSRCVSIVGTVGSYKSNIVLLDTYLHGASYGVLAQFASHVMIANPRVFDIAYAGITGTSVTQMHVLNPDIDMNNPVGTAGNAYGVAYSRETPVASDLTTNPRSTECSVVGGTVKNVQLWHGLDTHAGTYIAFIGTSIVNCLRGVNLSPSNNGSHVSTFAPHYCTVEGVIVDSTVTDGSRDIGVLVSGANGVEHAVGCTVRAFIKGHGAQGNGTSGGLYMTMTQSCRADVTTVECSPNSVAIQSNNLQFHLTVTSCDPWSTSVGRSTHVFISGDNDIGVISSFVLGAASKAAAFVNGEGIRVSAGAGMDVVLGVGYNGATLPIVDTGNITRTTLRASKVQITGKLLTAASGSAGAGLNIAPGSAPSAPVDGDMWVAAGGGLLVRLNGVTRAVQVV